MWYNVDKRKTEMSWSLSTLNQSSSASDDVESSVDEWKVCCKYSTWKTAMRGYWSLLVSAVKICHAKPWTHFPSLFKRDLGRRMTSTFTSSFSPAFLFCWWHVHFLENKISGFVPSVVAFFYYCCILRVLLFFVVTKEQKNIIFYETLMRVGNISVFSSIFVSFQEINTARLSVFFVSVFVLIQMDFRVKDYQKRGSEKQPNGDEWL